MVEVSDGISESFPAMELLRTPIMGSWARLFQRRHRLSSVCFGWSGLWPNREELAWVQISARLGVRQRVMSGRVRGGARRLGSAALWVVGVA